MFIINININIINRIIIIIIKYCVEIFFLNTEILSQEKDNVFSKYSFQFPPLKINPICTIGHNILL